MIKSPKELDDIIDDLENCIIIVEYPNVLKVIIKNKKNNVYAFNHYKSTNILINTKYMYSKYDFQGLFDFNGNIFKIELSDLILNIYCKIIEGYKKLDFEQSIMLNNSLCKFILFSYAK